MFVHGFDPGENVSPVIHSKDWFCITDDIPNFGLIFLWLIRRSLKIFKILSKKSTKINPIKRQNLCKFLFFSKYRNFEDN